MNKTSLVKSDREVLLYFLIMSDLQITVRGGLPDCEGKADREDRPESRPGGQTGKVDRKVDREVDREVDRGGSSTSPVGAGLCGGCWSA